MKLESIISEKEKPSARQKALIEANIDEICNMSCGVCMSIPKFALLKLSESGNEYGKIIHGTLGTSIKYNNILHEYIVMHGKPVIITIG